MESEASPLVTVDDKAEELIKCVSPDVRKPFKADRRGLFPECGPPAPEAAALAEALAITEGVGAAAPWAKGVKGRG